MLWLPTAAALFRRALAAHLRISRDLSWRFGCPRAAALSGALAAHLTAALCFFWSGRLISGGPICFLRGRSIPLLPALEIISRGQPARRFAIRAEVAAGVPVIDGVRFATAEAGSATRPHRPDAGRVDAGTAAAGVLTRSKTCSAPVLWCRENLSGRGARAGRQFRQRQRLHRQEGQRGRRDRRRKLPPRPSVATPSEVYVASTGVIGEPLDAGKFALCSTALAKSAKPDAFENAARAIMTTDTYPKLATRTAEIGGVPVHHQRLLQGRRHDRARHGDDAVLPVHRRRHRAGRAAEPARRGTSQTTFNCMTVDGDTSTSDTCLLFATGAAAKRGQQPWPTLRPAPRGFRRGAPGPDARPRIQVAKDGEGLSKFVTFEVDGRRELGRGAQDRARLRQLADPEDRDRRRGPQLGPRRHGRR